MLLGGVYFREREMILKTFASVSIPYLHLSPMIKEKYTKLYCVLISWRHWNHTEVIDANSHPIFIYPTAKHRTWKYKHVFQIFLFSYDIVIKWEWRFSGSKIINVLFRPTNLSKLFQKGSFVPNLEDNFSKFVIKLRKALIYEK